MGAGGRRELEGGRRVGWRGMEWSQDEGVGWRLEELGGGGSSCVVGGGTLCGGEEICEAGRIWREE